jgi:hypothetical protein
MDGFHEKRMGSGLVQQTWEGMRRRFALGMPSPHQSDAHRVLAALGLFKV